MSSKKMIKRSLTSEMDRNVRQMLKLIEDNGDSFAQKAEMYYKKRPELISLVEEFYRGYRSLAERYDHVTIELLSKNNLSDLQSLTSCVSDNGSDPPSFLPSPRKMGRRISTNRAPGFDFFLGNSNGNVFDGSSTLTDSDEDYDDFSSVNSFDNGLSKRVLELEKICMNEQELRNLNEKLRISEEEINKLKIEVENYKSKELSSNEEEIKTLMEELRITKEKLDSSEMEIASLKLEATKSSECVKKLKNDLNLAQKDVSTWKTKFNSKKRESTKLHEAISRWKTSLSDAEQKNFLEKAELKSEMCKILGEKTHLEEKIRELECKVQSLEHKNGKIQCEKLEMEEKLKGEIDLLKEDIKDHKAEEICSLKEENMSRDNQIEEMDMQLTKLEVENVVLIDGMEEAQKQVEELKSRVKQLVEEIEKQRVLIIEGAEEKREAIRQLCFSIDHYRSGYNRLRQAFIGHKRVTIWVT